MDRIRFGLQVRALRHRRRWRQEDLAGAVGVSRSAISRIERGEADRFTVRMLGSVAAGLGARVECRLAWHGEGLDRLLDADHASSVEQVVRSLQVDGWLAATEVSFAVFGERGSIDVLAFHAATSTLLVVEVKSVVPDVQATLFGIDRKARLASDVGRGRGWDAARVWRLLVIRESRTSRRRVDEHAGTFGAQLPARTRAVRRALREPERAPTRFAGIWFLSGGTHARSRHRVSRRRGG